MNSTSRYLDDSCHAFNNNNKQFITQILPVSIQKKSLCVSGKQVF